jgi:hypothetical protein
MDNIPAIAASFSNYVAEKPISKTNKKGSKKPMPFPPKKQKPEEEEEEKEVQDEEEMNDEGEEEEETGEESEMEGCEVTPDAVREVLAKLSGDAEHWNEVPDDKLIPALNHVVDALMEGEDEEEQESEEGEPIQGGLGKEKGERVATRIKHEEEHYHPPQPIAASHALVKRERKARQAEIIRLAKDGYITIPVKNQLEERFCSDEALQLAFDDDLSVIDSFDDTIEMIKANGKVIKKDVRSQNDALELSYQEMYDRKGAAENNPLIRNAEARAKAVGQA